MKLIALICAALTCALHFPVSAQAAADSSVQQSECLPHRTRENAAWPVRAIYLHGLFKGPGGPDLYGWRQLEFSNRRKLEKIARRLHFRIAVPLAPVMGKTRVHQWNTTDLPKIELAAARACGVRKLPPKRALIGFSNGGYRARKIGLQPCAKTQDYEMILAIGAPEGTRGSNCQADGKRKLLNVAPHFFNEQLITDKLESLSPLKAREWEAPDHPPLPPVRESQPTDGPTSGAHSAVQ